MQLSSNNGGIRATGLSGDSVLADTDHGDNQLRTDPTSDRRLTIRSDNGNVTARNPD